MPYIICKQCNGEGDLFCGMNHHTNEAYTEECNICSGLGYLPLLGWAVLDSTYGSDTNTCRRKIEKWLIELSNLSF
jgi:hypothetical protein